MEIKEMLDAVSRGDSSPAKLHKKLLLEAARYLRDRGELKLAVGVELGILVIEEACERILKFESEKSCH